MHPKNQQGIALIFSLLILSLVTLIGLGITAVITRELKLSQNIGHSVAAFYASESGVERGLYRVKEGKVRGDEVVDVISDIRAYNSSSFASGAQYDNEATDFTSSEATDILENESIQLDYTELGACGLGGACVDSWRFEWNDDVTSTADKVEVTFIGWINNPALIPPLTYTENTYKIILDNTGPGSSPRTINNIGLPDNDPVQNKFYRVRVKALGGDLNSLKLTACTSELAACGTEISAATNIVVQATGQKQRFNQSFTAIVPWQTPLTGIFDYVLFSELDLLKNVAVTSNPAIYRTGRLEIEQGVSSLCSCIVGEAVGGIINCQGSGWLGGCDGGSWGSALHGARCLEPVLPNTCSIEEVNIDPNQTLNPAGLYITPDIASLGIPSGSYYVRIEGETFLSPSIVRLDEDIVNNPGVSPYTEEFTPPASCRFNCVFSSPVRLGLHCDGGDNDGDACVDNGDCPGGACSNNFQKIYFLSTKGTGEKTFLDWYSLGSSPLLTGPDDVYCVDLEATDCL